MAPRVKMFKAGSIIYFKGDKSDSVYLLKSGRVILEYNDIQTDERRQDIIKNGEFFGVKSGLIRMEREENANAVQDSVIIEFSTADFEALISKNTSIMLKMLKVFSNQLRRIGKEVQSLVTDKVSGDTASEFFNIGEYYLKNKRYSQAIAVYNRFLNTYPDDYRKDLIAQRIALAQKCFTSYGDEGGPALQLDFNIEKPNVSKPVNGDDLDFNTLVSGVSDNPAQNDYEEACSLMNANKYVDAFNILKKVLTMQDEHYKEVALYKIGVCLFNLGKYQEVTKHLSSFVGKYKDAPERKEAFYLIGASFAKTGNHENAKQALKNIIANGNQNEDIYRRAVKLYKEL